MFVERSQVAEKICALLKYHPGSCRCRAPPLSIADCQICEDNGKDEYHAHEPREAFEKDRVRAEKTEQRH